MVAAVLSGNRNFEGRINPQTRFNYLASPPLVVAYALAGRMDIDFEHEPFGVGADGPVFLRDIWPAPKEVEEEILTVGQERDIPARSTRTCSRAMSSGEASWSRRVIGMRGREVHLREESAVFRRDDARRRRASGRSRGARTRRCSAIRSRPTTFHRRARSPRQAPPDSGSSSTGSRPRISTRTAHGAATTR